jgi:hypothetical protein
MTTNYTTQTLLSNIVYGTPSGNYDGSSQLFYSDPVSAANYYGGQGALQTITYRLQDAIVKITIQATLNDSRDAAKWFDVDSYGDGESTDTGTFPVNALGNFVWVRARVEMFDSGTIQSVTVAY